MEPFVIRAAAGEPVPVVASIPHTGTYVPEAVKSRFASDAMRRLPMTDWHLHLLYDFLPRLGITTIHATWSRFLADLNRPPEPRELYPGRFETGLVARETFWGDTIWQEPPTEDEIAGWKRAVHAPYHARLQQLLDETRERHGRAVLIDCHSVASRASKLHDELADDIYLGDRDGETNPGWLTDTVDEAFRRAGYRVVRNTPYKGGYITDHYGHQEGVEALQIEMCQRLYMDEADPEGALRHPKFAALKPVLERVFDELVKSSKLQI